MFPLDKRATPGTSGSLGYVTSLYKVRMAVWHRSAQSHSEFRCSQVVDTTDGHVYALRRCDKVSMPYPPHCIVHSSSLCLSDHVP